MQYRSVVAVVVTIACAVLTSCGDESERAVDDAPVVATPVAATTTIALSEEPEPAPPTIPQTVPPSPAPATTVPASTTTTTTPPTTVPGVADCLNGSWSLSPEGVTTLYANLLPGFPIEVTGSHFVTFAANTVDFWTLLEIRFLAGGTDVSFGLDQHGVGTFEISSESVALFNYETFERRLHDGVGSADSNPSNDPAVHADQFVDLADNGDGTITINRVTVPVPDLPPVAGGPIGCSGDQMSIGFTSGLAETAAVYTRVS